MNYIFKFSTTCRLPVLNFNIPAGNLYQISTRPISYLYQISTRPVGYLYQSSTQPVAYLYQILTRSVGYLYQSSTRSVGYLYQISSHLSIFSKFGKYLQTEFISSIFEQLPTRFYYC